MTAYPRSWAIERLGIVMQPRPGDPHEIEGVLNPGGATGLDGHFYLLPRLVARGNSRTIGLAKVTYSFGGKPQSVERRGIVLSPLRSSPQEVRKAREEGDIASLREMHGVEDPRVCWSEPLNRYVMAYTAYGFLGPRLGLALSENLMQWERIPLIWDDREESLASCDNKDVIFVPEPVRDPRGVLCWALIHRPANDPHPGIWISYCPASTFAETGTFIWGHSQPLFWPDEMPWRAEKVGAGCLVPLEHTWALFYHGVSPTKTYSAGVLYLEPGHPHIIQDVPRDPLLWPDTPAEKTGTVNNVVFPTAANKAGASIDLFYGAADKCVCAARLTPEYT